MVAFCAGLVALLCVVWGVCGPRAFLVDNVDGWGYVGMAASQKQSVESQGRPWATCQERGA